MYQNRNTRRTIIKPRDPNHPLIKFISIEGLPILKIAKHCDEEAGTSSESQGVLLGLVRDDHLEVTNCFPFPRHGEDEEVDDMDYQIRMMRHLRNANVDHLHVGWYQSNPNGSYAFKLDTIDSQHLYQNVIAESIVLLYDPVRAQRGFIALKAYRLTPTAMKLCKEGEFTLQTLKQNGFSFTKFFEEIPVRIKNSNLITGLMCNMDASVQADEGKQLLDLASFGGMEKSLQSMMKCVDKIVLNQRHVVLKKQQIQRENQNRISRGEAILTEEECAKIMKSQTPVQRLESILSFSQTLNYCKQASSYAAQNTAKLCLNKTLNN